ncbi:ribosome small subunit-dependent GTPase A [Melioribacter sp. Ez-97]|uniref:ribosome small subunit-dependent GTPase A n=1 Tax=Melioribacter sp. Ez-97 TaxID=3423434 RepID=UPI003EDAC2E9
MLDDNGGEIRCFLRGKILNEYKLKKDKLITLDIAAVGDVVEFNLNEDGTGVIEDILERKNHISRKAPRMKGASYRGERLEQVIAANVDKMIIVNSWDLPKFNNRLVDRMLVVAESSGVEPSIVINKIDLDKSNERKKFVDLYQSIGYKVFETSAVNNEGISGLKEFIRNSVSVFWGHSGVGKSSILNKLYPGLNFKVGKVSDYNRRGRHTTVTAVMKKVEENTFVIDTPGIREIDPYGIKKEDLGHFFIEFGEFIQNCRFNTCTHYHEPGCGVIEAYRNGKISRERYESYLALLETIEEDLFF